MKRGILLLLLCCMAGGCERAPERTCQGYVEGEFVYVASPLAGELETLAVERGAQVKMGDLLFALEHGAELAAQEEASLRLAQARANLEDARRGQRPTEIQSLEAQLEQAKAALVWTEKEFRRQEKLVRTGASAAQELDRTRAERDQDRQRAAKLEADLATARLGSREDQIAAAEAAMKAQAAALARAEWDLSQKRQAAAVSGLVFDTLYRVGEWVPAGRPVVMLLPPENVKVRAFVPETLVGSLQPGNAVRVHVDGRSEPVTGRISYISPRAEYTPPVIYSRESRQKLVFLVEITFDKPVAAELHPGQPVDVTFEK